VGRSGGLDALSGLSTGREDDCEKCPVGQSCVAGSVQLGVCAVTRFYLVFVGVAAQWSRLEIEQIDFVKPVSMRTGVIRRDDHNLTMHFLGARALKYPQTHIIHYSIDLPDTKNSS
jgi:hypothetical protein